MWTDTSSIGTQNMATFLRVSSLLEVTKAEVTWTSH